MSEAAGTEAAGTEAAGTEAAGTETAATETQTQTAEQAEAQTVDALPDWAQKLVRDARKEAGDHRAKALTAADEATKNLTSQLAKALGLAKDDEPLDPAKLTEQLSAKDQAIRDLKVERALDKAARKVGADEDLLDAVLTRKGALAGLDPSADDFTQQLDALVKAEVDANPKLKAARAAGASGVELSGGTGEQGQITEQQLKTMTPEQIVAAQAKGLLRNLLG